MLIIISALNCFILLTLFRSTKNSKNKKRKATFFNIEKLERKVEQDREELDPLMVGDINVSEFLEELEKENKKWNVSVLSTQDIKGMSLSL